MARKVPSVMVTFVAKDILANHRLKKAKDGKNELSLLANIVIEMFTAFFVVMITNPVDVIKMRMMAQAASVEVPESSVEAP